LQTWLWSKYAAPRRAACDRSALPIETVVHPFE
jgi:hypothetical protein